MKIDCCLAYIRFICPMFICNNNRPISSEITTLSYPFFVLLNYPKKIFTKNLVRRLLPLPLRKS
jgi:hypothetical protein